MATYGHQGGYAFNEDQRAAMRDDASADDKHVIETTSKVTKCRATEELGNIRATLLVNFGETKHNRYGFVLKDSGSTHDLMCLALDRLYNLPASRIDAIRQKLESIVCTKGCDRGVILLSHDSPTHTEIVNGSPMQVYDHENFSPLGDALIELHDITKGSSDGQEGEESTQTRGIQGVRRTDAQAHPSS